MQQCRYFHLACEQADGRAKPRDKKVSLLWSLHIFLFHPGTRRKKLSQLLFSPEVWTFAGFHNKIAVMQRQCKKSFAEEKLSMFMSSKDKRAHLIPSDLPLAIWSWQAAIFNIPFPFSRLSVYKKEIKNSGPVQWRKHLEFSYNWQNANRNLSLNLDNFCFVSLHHIRTRGNLYFAVGQNECYFSQSYHTLRERTIPLRQINDKKNTSMFIYSSQSSFYLGKILSAVPLRNFLSGTWSRSDNQTIKSSAFERWRWEKLPK